MVHEFELCAQDAGHDLSKLVVSRLTPNNVGGKGTYIEPVLALMSLICMRAIAAGLLGDDDGVDVARGARQLDCLFGAVGGACASASEHVESGRRVLR